MTEQPAKPRRKKGDGRTTHPNPTKAAKKCNFTLDEPMDIKRARHPGTCECGTRGACAYDSFTKKKFCRNPSCKYYQKGKRLDQQEMYMVVEARGCTNAKIEGTGINAKISYTCPCGFEQEDTWQGFYADTWCRYPKCEHYHPNRHYNTNTIKQWLALEGYSTDEDFCYVKERSGSHTTKYTFYCPKGHSHECTIERWVRGSRCKTCNGDGRTLSYNQIKERYEAEGCKLMYEEDDFVGNVTEVVVPYKCNKGHCIDNLTMNDFANRLGSKLGPCAVCRTNSRDRQLEHEKMKRTMRARYGVDYASQVPQIFSKACRRRKKAIVVVPDERKEEELYFDSPEEEKCYNLLDAIHGKDEILRDPQDMPEIWFHNPVKGKKSRYYPDFYIPTKRLVVETKSDYFMCADYPTNITKFEATCAAGYTCHLYVYTRDLKLLYEKVYTPEGPGIIQVRHVTHIRPHPFPMSNKDSESPSSEDSDLLSQTSDEDTEESPGDSFGNILMNALQDMHGENFNETCQDKEAFARALFCAICK